MAGTYLTSGVVLRRKDHREFDRLYTLYTEDYGKIEAVARGVRKVTSKLAGHLEPLSYSSFMLASGRRFDVLATSVRISSFKFPHTDLLAYALANYYCEAIDRLTKPAQPDQGLFALLVDFIRTFDAELDKHGGSEQFQRLLVTEYFLYQLLVQMGYAPSLGECVVGHEELARGGATINISHGGLVCDAHRDRGDITQALSGQSLEILRLMADRQLEPLRMMDRSSEALKEVARAINTFLRYHLDEPLASTTLVNMLLTQSR